MQFELFNLTEIDDREIFDNPSHHMSPISTRRKRPIKRAAIPR